MQHTIAAVFNQQNNAQQARDALLASGLSSNDVHLAQKEKASTGDAAEEHESFGAEIKSFFHNLFSSDDAEDAALYSEAVQRGSYVVTVDVSDEKQVDKVASVLDRYNPVDVEDLSAEWKSGAANTGATQTSSSARTSGAQTSKAIPVIQEELKVGKRQVQRGGVRVYQHVEEKPVNQSIGLREDHVKVERHAVDKPASPADIAALKGGSFELRETAEEAVVEKTARVVEEVVVGIESTERTAQINDKLKRTEVDIEQLPGGQANDQEFRTHWSSTYKSGGGRYEDYAPAYAYGSTLAASDRYKGKRWADSESSIRSDWESKNPGSAWDKFKGAIQRGWEKVSS